MRASASPNYKRQRLEYLKNRRLKRQEQQKRPLPGSPEIISRKKDFIIKRQVGPLDYSSRKQEMTQKRQNQVRMQTMDQNHTERAITHFHDGEPGAVDNNQPSRQGQLEDDDDDDDDKNRRNGNQGDGPLANDTKGKTYRTEDQESYHETTFDNQANQESQNRRNQKHPDATDHTKSADKIRMELEHYKDQTSREISNLQTQLQQMQAAKIEWDSLKTKLQIKVFDVENENLELKTENSKLKEDFRILQCEISSLPHLPITTVASSSTNEVSKLHTDRTLLPPPKLDLFSIKNVLFTATISLDFCNALFSEFSSAPPNAQQDFLMEMKTWLLDRGALHSLQSANLEMSVNLLLQISISQSLSPNSNPAPKKLCGLLIDKLLNCQPQGGMILSMVHLIHLTIPPFQNKVSESEYLLLKFYLNCSQKFVQVSSEMNAFRFLQLVSDLFLKRPPQELNPSLPSLQIFDEVFRGVRALSDQVIKRHPAKAQMFYQAYKESLKDSVFLNYVSNFLIALQK